MRTYVLRVYEAGKNPSGADPLELFEIEATGATRIASEQFVVSSEQTFTHEGAARNLTELLSEQTLVNQPLLQAAGEHLYQRLAQGSVGAKLAELGDDTRVMLDLHGDRLAALPWELIRRGGQALFSFRDHPWSRGAAEWPKPPAPLKPSDPTPPLRILILVGNRRDDDKVLGDEELRLVEDELQRCNARVLLEVLVRPTPKEISATVERHAPHVLHFIGHCTIINGRPHLRVHSQATGQGFTLDGGALQMVLTNVPLPRLVILNACNTAQPFQSWDIATVFLDAGVPAVLAMQAPIRGKAAAQFSRSLYERLVAGRAIDSAVADARNELALTGAHDDKLNWPIPRLVVRGDPDFVLSWGARQKGPVLRAIDDFVDRWPQRRAAWETFYPRGGDASRLVVIRGAQSSGKSELLKLLGETSMRVLGNRAVYVDLGGPNGSGIGPLLNRVRDAVATAGLPVTRLAALDPEKTSIDKVGTELRQALEEAAVERPLLLLLDGLDAWDQHVLTAVVLREVCFPYADPAPASHVRVAVAMRPAHADAVRWKDDYGIEPIEIGRFSAAEWSRVAGQFIRFHLRELAQFPEKQARFNTRAWGIAALNPADYSVLDPGDAFDVDWLDLIRAAARKVART